MTIVSCSIADSVSSNCSVILSLLERLWNEQQRSNHLWFEMLKAGNQPKAKRYKYLHWADFKRTVAADIFDLFYVQRIKRVLKIKFIGLQVWQSNQRRYMFTWRNHASFAHWPEDLLSTEITANDPTMSVVCNQKWCNCNWNDNHEGLLCIFS